MINFNEYNKSEYIKINQIDQKKLRNINIRINQNI